MNGTERNRTERRNPWLSEVLLLARVDTLLKPASLLAELAVYMSRWRLHGVTLEMQHLYGGAAESTTSDQCELINPRKGMLETRPQHNARFQLFEASRLSSLESNEFQPSTTPPYIFAGRLRVYSCTYSISPP